MRDIKSKPDSLCSFLAPVHESSAKQTPRKPLLLAVDIRDTLTKWRRKVGRMRRGVRLTRRRCAEKKDGSPGGAGQSGPSTSSSSQLSLGAGKRDRPEAEEERRR